MCKRSSSRCWTEFTTVEYRSKTVSEEQNPDGDEQEDQGSLNIDGRIIGGIGFCLQRVWI